GQPALLGAARVNWKLVDERSRRHIVRVGDNARHQYDHRVVVADSGDRPDDIGAQGGLSPRALHVDDRAGAGDDDRLFERSDFEVGVDRRDEGSGQFNVFAPERREARQREGDGVGAGPEIFDAVLSRGIGDAGADFFDEYRTRRFDAHPGKDGAGRVLDGTCDDRLSQSGRRQYERQRGDGDAETDETAHTHLTFDSAATGAHWR